MGVGIDLHTHTTASDGSLTPSELVALAAESGIAVLGITDHDTTDGLGEGMVAAEECGITLVPGVELNCDLEHGHADILGYLIDSEAPELCALLAKIRRARIVRAQSMVERLQALGAPVTYEEVRALAGDGVVGRPHVAQVLVDCGFVADVPSAFREYIGRDGPAYADRYRLTPAGACRIIRGAGGVPSLAHPVPAVNPRSDPLELRKFLPHLVEAGLGGMECYYPGYAGRFVRWLETLADHFGLVPTGGSDYHGQGWDGRRLGETHVPADTFERLRKAVG